MFRTFDDIGSVVPRYRSSAGGTTVTPRYETDPRAAFVTLPTPAPVRECDVASAADRPCGGLRHVRRTCGEAVPHDLQFALPPTRVSAAAAEVVVTPRAYPRAEFCSSKTAAPRPSRELIRAFEKFGGIE